MRKIVQPTSIVLRFSLLLALPVTLLLLLLCPYLFSQNNKIDSLKNCLGLHKNDSNKVNTLNALSAQLRNIGNYDEALQYAKEAFINAQQSDYKNGYAEASYILGGIYYLKSNYAEALKHMLLSARTYEGLNDNSRVADAYSNVGVIYDEQGKYALSLENYYKSLKIRNSSGTKKDLAASYDNIGAAYFNLGNYELAEKNHFESLKLRLEINDAEDIARTYGNIGNLYSQQRKYAEAVKYYLKSLEIQKKIESTYDIAKTYNNLGHTYTYQLDYREGMKNYLKALNIRREIKDTLGIASTLQNMGGAMIQQKEYVNAEKYLLESLDFAERIGDLRGMLNSNKLLSDLYGILNKPSMALKHYQVFISVRDSIFNEENIRKIAQIEMTYEFDRKEAMLKAEQYRKDVDAQLRLHKKNNLIYGFAGATFILLLSMGVIIMFYRQNKFRQAQKALKMEQKLLRLQMNPHFIFNSLGVIQSIIQKNKTEEAMFYLSKFSKLLREILENSRNDYISLAQEFLMLERYLDLQKLVFDNEFDYNIYIDDTIDREQLLVPPMLAQPFIENALKHGLREKDEKGKIEIRFMMNDHVLLFGITDNGIGIQKSKELKKRTASDHQSLAMTITQERLINLRKSKGNKITIDIRELRNIQDEITGTAIQFEIPYKLN